MLDAAGARENDLAMPCNPAATATAYGRIEIGVCSDMGGTALAGVDGLAELRSVTEPRPFRAVCRRFFGHLARLMEEHDADARIQFVEIVPPQARAEEFAEIAFEHGMPLKQFTRLCVLGGDDDNPDAVEALAGYLTLAKRAGTVDRLNIQVLGDSTTPSLDALCDFYLRAEEMAQAQGIELYTETHVDRFSHDPRRLLAVHDRLREATGGRTGLRVAADFSHYLHQIGNPHFPQWAAIAAGELNLDPLDQDNLLSRRIVQAGLIGNGHLRAAVPNDLPRDRGSIQYPIVDPRTDAATAHLPNGGMDRPWEAARLGPWVALYRQIFAYQLAHTDRPVARFSAEYLGDGAGDFRVEPYRNLFQNLAAVSFAHALIRELRGGPQPGADTARA